MQCVVLIPDIHWPHHDRHAVAAAIEICRRIRPDQIVVLGDALDCDQFSSHATKELIEQRSRSFLSDLNGFRRQVLDPLAAVTPYLVYLEGNHEQRVERWCTGSDTQRAAWEALSPRLRYSDVVHWIPYLGELTRYVVGRGLWAVHGWSHAAHAAATHLATAQSVSIVYGHTHRIEMASTRHHASGRLVSARSPGCLAKLKGWQTSPISWGHGVCVAYTDGPRHWIYTVEIHRGQVPPLPGVPR